MTELLTRMIALALCAALITYTAHIAMTDVPAYDAAPAR